MRLAIFTLLALALTGCATHIPVRTQIDIDAPVDQVFDTLIDFKEYPHWNPYHVRVVGKPEIGEPLDVRVQRPDGKVVDVPAVHVLRLKENTELTWGGGMKGIFYGEHIFKLKALSKTTTRLTHNEDFRGIFIGFADLPPEVLHEGYRNMNLALKNHLEQK